MKKGNYVFIFVLFFIIFVVIFFMPDIYKKYQMNKITNIDSQNNINNNDNTNEEKITIDNSIINDLTFPIMRNDKYKIESYYQLDNISINNFSNNDILYNAFLDLYDGYIVDHSKIGCTSNSKEVDALYLKSRIKNIIGKNVNYNLEDFTVPNNINNKYVGLWKYNSSTNSFIYYGDCNNSINSNIIYYDLNKFYKLETSNNNNTLYLYYYVGFAKIDGNYYTIYNDADMTNAIFNGTINDIEDLNNIFNNLDMSMFKKYKYTFKLGLCTYDNYCFNKGEWVND